MPCLMGARAPAGRRRGVSDPALVPAGDHLAAGQPLQPPALAQLAVLPPATHSVSWWPWQCPGSPLQPGQVQRRSRSASAFRILGVAVRYLRPTCRGSPPALSGMGVSSASEAIRRSAFPETGKPQSSSAAGAPGSARSVSRLAVIVRWGRWPPRTGSSPPSSTRVASSTRPSARLAGRAVVGPAARPPGAARWAARPGLGTVEGRLAASAGSRRTVTPAGPPPRRPGPRPPVDRRRPGPARPRSVEAD